MRLYLHTVADAAIDAESGRLVPGSRDTAATPAFTAAPIGTVISLLDHNYRYSVAAYAVDADPKLIYTYSYAPEQAWLRFVRATGFIDRGSDFTSSGLYFRLTLKRADGKAITLDDAAKINDIVRVEAPPDYADPPAWVAAEAMRVADLVLPLTEQPSLVLALITDTHIAIGGTWRDTLAGLAATHRLVNFDGLVHLGDLTDGMVSQKVTADYARAAIADLRDLGMPLYLLIGNHDTNYFANNREPLTEPQQYALYQRFMDGCVCREGNALYYHRDWPSLKLRALFLSSFDYLEQMRYGFPPAELDWLERTLAATPDDWHTLIFSHLAPTKRLDYWSRNVGIRNEATIMRILGDYQRRTRRLLGYVHGHTHADLIDRESGFPVVSLAPAKCEDFHEYKPDGSFTRPRKLGTASQECWDALVVAPSTGTLSFVRFGSGQSPVRRVAVGG